MPDLAQKLNEQKRIAAAASTILESARQISGDIASKAAKEMKAIEDERSQSDPSFSSLNATEKAHILAQENPDYADALRTKEDWQTGGGKSRAVNTVTGIITGALGGQGIEQIAANAAAPYAATIIGGTFGDKGSNPNKAAQLLSHAVLGAAMAYANNGNAVAGAVSGAGAEAAADVLLKTLHPGKSVDELSVEERKGLADLSSAVAVVAGGLTGDTLSDAAIGGVVGKNAVENNWFSTAMEQGMRQWGDGAQSLYVSKKSEGASDNEVSEAINTYMRGRLPKGQDPALGLVHGFFIVGTVPISFAGGSVPLGIRIGSGALAGLADVSLQSATKKPKESINSTDAGISTVVGALTAGKGTIFTTVINMGGAYFSSNMKGENPKDSMISSGFGTLGGKYVGDKVTKDMISKGSGEVLSKTAGVIAENISAEGIKKGSEKIFKNITENSGNEQGQKRGSK